MLAEDIPGRSYTKEITFSYRYHEFSVIETRKHKNFGLNFLICVQYLVSATEAFSEIECNECSIKIRIDYECPRSAARLTEFVDSWLFR